MTPVRLRTSWKLPALGALLASFIAAAPPARAQAIKGDGGKVRLLFSPAGTNSFPPFIMKKFALDKKYGFELETIPQPGATQASITAIQGGAADIGLFGWTDIVRMRNAGVNVIGIAPFLTWANTVVVPVNSPLKTLADLKGKKVGVFGRTNLDWIVMRAAGQKDFRIDLDKEVVVQEGAVGLLRGLMENGQLDATQMFNSLTPDMVASGKFRVLATIRGLIENMGLPLTPFLIYSVDVSFAAAHPANVRAFLAAYRESIEILNANDAVWVERGKELKMDDQAALILFRDEARADMMTKFTSTTEADIRKTFDVLLATGGADVLGIDKLTTGFMTLEYQ